MLFPGKISKIVFQLRSQFFSDVRSPLRHIKRIFPGFFTHAAEKSLKIPVFNRKLFSVCFAEKPAFVFAIQKVPFQKIRLPAAFKAHPSAETAVAVPGLPSDALFSVQTIEHGQDKFMYGGLSGSVFRPDHIDPVMKRQLFIHKISEIF